MKLHNEQNLIKTLIPIDIGYSSNHCEKEKTKFQNVLIKL